MGHLKQQTERCPPGGAAWRTIPSPLVLIPYAAMAIGLHLLGSAWVSFLIYHGLVLALIWRRADLRRDLWRGWRWTFGLGAVAFGALGGVVLLVLAPHAGVDAALIVPALGRLGLAGDGWLLFVLYHALVNTWFEEALWRGRLGSDARGLVPCDLLFAGYHALVLVLFLDWIWILPALVILTVAAWFWRQLRRRAGGLLLPAVSHLAADAGIMGVVYLLGRG